MHTNNTMKPWNAADYLDSPEMIAAYLSAALEENDSAFFLEALGTVARAKGMGSVAQHAGLSRESLYRALSDKGNPSLTTFVSVVDALGLRLSLVPKSSHDEPVHNDEPVQI